MEINKQLLLSTNLHKNGLLEIYMEKYFIILDSLILNSCDESTININNISNCFSKMNSPCEIYAVLQYCVVINPINSPKIYKCKIFSVLTREHSQLLIVI